VNAAVWARADVEYFQCGDLDVAVDVVREAVHEDHRRAVGRAGLRR
jgi:hypothetical protein